MKTWRQQRDVPMSWQFLNDWQNLLLTSVSLSSLELSVPSCSQGCLFQVEGNMAIVGALASCVVIALGID